MHALGQSHSSAPLPRASCVCAQASRPRVSRRSASRPPASPTALPLPSARSRRAEAPPRSASASRPSSRRAPLSSPFLVVYPLPLWASCTACLLPAARIPHCGVTPPTALQERYGAELSDRELEVAARDEMVSRMEAQLQVNHPPPSPLLTPASPDTRWCPCLSPAHSGVPPPPPHPSPLRGCRARASTSRASPTSWRRCRAATASCSSCRRTLLRPLSPPFASASHAARPSLPKHQPRPRCAPLPSSHEARTHPPRMHSSHRPPASRPVGCGCCRQVRALRGARLLDARGHRPLRRRGLRHRPGDDAPSPPALAPSRFF